MKINLWEIKLLIIINNNLYKKQVIEDNLYNKTNDKLLSMIKNGEINFD